LEMREVIECNTEGINVRVRPNRNEIFQTILGTGNSFWVHIFAKPLLPLLPSPKVLESDHQIKLYFN